MGCGASSAKAAPPKAAAGAAPTSRPEGDSKVSQRLESHKRSANTRLDVTSKSEALKKFHEHKVKRRSVVSCRRGGA